LAVDKAGYKHRSSEGAQSDAIFFKTWHDVKTLKIAGDYKPGDVVVWSLGGSVRHIGIVVDKKSNDGLRPLIVHNIGNGQELSDCLFNFPIIGHYQYPRP
jgi:uncharacterized protein YijF (DUF1287 family)